jgi:hypothetical protein
MNKYSLNKKGKIVGADLNRLEKKVVSIINQEDGPMLFIQDVLYGGCQAGTVGELIYYSDTTKWFKLYRQEIEDQVRQMQEELGMNLNELNGWDETDPFARETYNQNLLAWFSFETVCSEIQNSIEDC